MTRKVKSKQRRTKTHKMVRLLKRNLRRISLCKATKMRIVKPRRVKREKGKDRTKRVKIKIK